MRSETDRIKLVLKKSLDSEVRIILTDNRASIISARKNSLGWTVRLHHMFCAADQEVLETLCSFLNRPTEEDKKFLRSFIKKNEHKIRPQPARVAAATILATKGRYHDLRLLFDQLNQKHFQEIPDLSITWGKRSGKSARRSVRLGSYDPHKKLIRINPCLDHSSVPRYVVKGVIFHEMLHHIVPVEKENGRRVIHSPRFYELERSYPDHLRILEWKKRHLNKLLR